MEDASQASRGAAAGDGASVVSQHSSWSHLSHRTIPTVVGGGNSVQSIIGTGNYFDDTAQRSRRVVAARKIVCPKNTR